MLLSRKLKIFSILAIVGVVFVTASFVSPGWVICKISNMKSLMGISGIQGLPQKAHLSAGLWYYTLCIQRFIGNNEEEDCHLSTYPFNIESPFYIRSYDKFKGKLTISEALLWYPYFLVAVWHSDNKEASVGEIFDSTSGKVKIRLVSYEPTNQLKKFIDNGLRIHIWNCIWHKYR